MVQVGGLLRSESEAYWWYYLSTICTGLGDGLTVAQRGLRDGVGTEGFTCTQQGARGRTALRSSLATLLRWCDMLEHQ